MRDFGSQLLQQEETIDQALDDAVPSTKTQQRQKRNLNRLCKILGKWLLYFFFRPWMLMRCPWIYKWKKVFDKEERGGVQCLLIPKIVWMWLLTCYSVDENESSAAYNSLTRFHQKLQAKALRSLENIQDDGITESFWFIFKILVSLGVSDSEDTFDSLTKYHESY